MCSTHELRQACAGSHLDPSQVDEGAAVQLPGAEHPCNGSDGHLDLSRIFEQIIGEFTWSNVLTFSGRITELVI